MWFIELRIKISCNRDYFSSMSAKQTLKTKFLNAISAQMGKRESRNRIEIGRNGMKDT